MWLSNLRIWLALRRVRATEHRVKVAEDELAFWREMHRYTVEHAHALQTEDSIARALARATPFRAGQYRQSRPHI